MRSRLLNASLIQLIIKFRTIYSSNMNKTFDFYSSIYARLPANKDKDQKYSRYLKRIEDIVSKKPNPDLSNQQYMQFLNRLHKVSSNHRSLQSFSQINTENQILLDKIVQAQKRKQIKNQNSYILALHEKRFREQERINEQNKKIALRVINKTSTIDIKRSMWLPEKQSPKRKNQKSFYQSRVKDRKLPKLMPRSQNH